MQFSTKLGDFLFQLCNAGLKPIIGRHCFAAAKDRFRCRCATQQMNPALLSRARLPGQLHDHCARGALRQFFQKGFGFRDIFRRADFQHGHIQQFVAGIAIGIHGGVVHRQIFERFEVVDPQRQRVLVEQVLVAFALEVVVPVPLPITPFVGAKSPESNCCGA